MFVHRFPARPALLAAAVLLAAPGIAEAATTYCVHQSGDLCVGGSVDEGTNLQAALTAADQTDGNTVAIGRGSYTRVGGFSVGGPGHGIQIIGAGKNETNLTADTSVIAVLTVTEPAAGARISGMTIAATGTSQGGIRATGADIDHVSVVLPASSTGYPGVLLNGGSLTDSGIVSMPPFGNEGKGIETAGTARIERDSVRAQIAAVADNGDLTARDMTLIYGFVALEADGDGTKATLDDGLILLDKASTATSIALLPEGGGDVTVRSSTIIGTNPAQGTGMAVSAGAGHSSSGTLQSSIVKGLPLAVVRYSGGTANLTLGNDDMTVPPDVGAAGTYTPNSNIDVDPKFVDATSGYYELRWDSPLIDAGGTCGTPCQTVPDLDGLMRPIDGDGDGVAVRDIGAYEYGHRAPTITTAGATPGSAATNEPVTFSAVGTDADFDDLGSPLTYSWTFDDGGVAGGQTVVHAFAVPGPHTATVVAIDPTNLISPSASTTVTITSPSPVQTVAQIPPPPPVKDTTPPVLSHLSLSAKTFAVSSNPTATSARAGTKAKKPPPHGVTITFTLSEAATVVLTVEHPHTSSACVARNRKRRQSTKPCTTYVRDGAITRKALKAGAASVAFSGRIGTKRLVAGTYRVRASATDLAGNQAKSSPEATFTIV